MAITALPTPPSRADAANFAARADAFLPAIVIFAGEANALQADVNAKAAATVAAAQTAANAPGTTATSVTQLAVGTGAKSLAIEAGKNIVEGMWLTIAAPAAGGVFMVGPVTAYNSGTGALTVDVRYTGGSGTFASWVVAISPPIIFRSATAAQIWAGAIDSVAVTPAGLLAAAAFIALTDGSTITPNLGAGSNFTVTLAGNRTLANPTNALPGMSGVIEILQDGTGNRALAFGSAWKPRDRIAPSLSSGAGAINLLSYVVRSSGVIYFSVDGPF